MYLMTKAGFFEIDRWDGTPVPEHPFLKLPKQFIVRARARRDLERFREKYLPEQDVPIRKSPPGWDYEFRVYLTEREFGIAMAAVANDVDYRNFKSYCGAHVPDLDVLAHAVWESSFDTALVGGEE
jgi:hypothetical protein